MSALAPLIRRTLGRSGRLLIAVAVLLGLFQLALVAVAASLSASGSFSQLERLVPKFVVMVMGPALTSFAGMMSLSYFEPLIVMLLVQVAIYLAVEPAGDVEGGLVDLILARPVARHVLVTRSLIVMTGAVVLLPVAMAISLWVSLPFFAPPGEPWPQVRNVALLMVHLSAVSWCFGGIALAAGASVRRRGQAQSAIGVAAVAFYLMEFVGEAWPRQIWLARLSPFHHYHASSILARQTEPVKDLAILIGIGAIGVVAAYWKFQRRDM